MNYATFKINQLLATPRAVISGRGVHCRQTLLHVPLLTQIRSWTSVIASLDLDHQNKLLWMRVLIGIIEHAHSQHFVLIVQDQDSCNARSWMHRYFPPLAINLCATYRKLECVVASPFNCTKRKTFSKGKTTAPHRLLAYQLDGCSCTRHACIGKTSDWIHLPMRMNDTGVIRYVLSATWRLVKSAKMSPLQCIMRAKACKMFCDALSNASERARMRARRVPA